MTETYRGIPYETEWLRGHWVVRLPTLNVVFEVEQNCYPDSAAKQYIDENMELF